MNLHVPASCPLTITCLRFLAAMADACALATAMHRQRPGSVLLPMGPTRKQHLWLQALMHECLVHDSELHASRVCCHKKDAQGWMPARGPVLTRVLANAATWAAC